MRPIHVSKSTAFSKLTDDRRRFIDLSDSEDDDDGPSRTGTRAIDQPTSNSNQSPCMIKSEDVGNSTSSNGTSSNSISSDDRTEQKFSNGDKVIEIESLHRSGEVADIISDKALGTMTVVVKTADGDRFTSPADGLQLLKIEDGVDEVVREEVYVATRILNKRSTREGKVDYLVKWEGYDAPSWEPDENLTHPNVKALIQQYENTRAAPVSAPKFKRKLALVGPSAFSRVDPKRVRRGRFSPTQRTPASLSTSSNNQKVLFRHKPCTVTFRGSQTVPPLELIADKKYLSEIRGSHNSQLEVQSNSSTTSTESMNNPKPISPKSDSNLLQALIDAQTSEEEGPGIRESGMTYVSPIVDVSRNRRFENDTEKSRYTRTHSGFSGVDVGLACGSPVGGAGASSGTRTRSGRVYTQTAPVSSCSGTFSWNENVVPSSISSSASSSCHPESLGCEKVKREKQIVSTLSNSFGSTPNFTDINSITNSDVRKMSSALRLYNNSNKSSSSLQSVLQIKPTKKIFKRAMKLIAPPFPKGNKPKTFKCRIPGCQYEGARKRFLEDHMNSHTGEKPYKCKEKRDNGEPCEHRFRQKSHLNRHVRAQHRKEKPHKCKNCKKSFAQRSNMVIHMRNVHRIEIPRKDLFF